MEWLDWEKRDCRRGIELGIGKRVIVEQIYDQGIGKEELQKCAMEGLGKGELYRRYEMEGMKKEGWYIGMEQGNGVNGKGRKGVLLNMDRES